MSIDLLLSNNPFKKNKETEFLFLSALNNTIQSYYSFSDLYKNYCKQQKVNIASGNITIENIPFIPVQVFKHSDFLTVDSKNIIDVRHSSGTSSGTPSSVKRDKITLERYKKSRNAVLNNFCQNDNKIQIGVIEDPELNPNPYLSANLVISVIESRAKDGDTFYIASSKDGDIGVDVDYFLELIQKNQNDISIIFGHTAYIYLFLIKELQRRHIKLNLSHVTMLFGWGWKKYIDKAVSNDVFYKSINDTLGISSDNILDMYGFAESNTLYLECKEGYRHAPIWEDVLVRNPKTLEVCSDREIGLLQFLSPIPNSYAGASVLLDDLGFSERNMRCKCGREGTRFKVIGRASDKEKEQFNNLTESLIKINN